MKNKIVVTGGSGRFGEIFKKISKKNYHFPNKKDLNIMSLKNIENYLKKNKPKILIHLAGLSRPMSLHEKKYYQKYKFKYSWNLQHSDCV